jgi:hypothetical protein
MRRTLLLMWCACVVRVGEAQTAQDWSAHLSAFQTEFRAADQSSVGRGAEVQLRRTIGKMSIAIGGQFTDHPGLTPGYKIGGVLVEPRYVIPVGSQWFYPYVLARAAALRRLNSPEGESLSGFDIGAGGGFIVPLSRRVNLDVGGAVTSTQWTFNSDFGFGTRATSRVRNYALKGGFSVGLGS